MKHLSGFPIDVQEHTLPIAAYHIDVQPATMREYMAAVSVTTARVAFERSTT